MRVLDLFSGIGGFALGFERAGLTTASFCEIDPFCCEWLAQRWPDTPIYRDVRLLNGRSTGPIDVVCGGFPCQDISVAGNGAGLDGDRSGLWFEMRRIVSEVRPFIVVLENVSALRSRGADRIYSDMETLGYSGWFFVVGADDVGFPHRRKRCWGIFVRLADARSDFLRQLEQRMPGGWPRRVCDSGQAVARDNGAGELADTDVSAGEQWGADDRARSDERPEPPRGGREELADSSSGGLRADGCTPGRTGHADERGSPLADSDSGRLEGVGIAHHRVVSGARGDQPHGCGGARSDDRRHGEPVVVHADASRLERLAGDGAAEYGFARRPTSADAGFRRVVAGPGEPQHGWEASRTISNVECRLGAAADGLPRHMGPTLNRARLKAVGNSVLPDITEIIGRVIMRLPR